MAQAYYPYMAPDSQAIGVSFQQIVLEIQI